MSTINLHLGDSLEAMRLMADNQYDLAIVDVPYGIGEDGRNNHTRSKLAKAADFRHCSQYDNEPPPQEYFDQLFRVSKNQIVWGANHFISQLPFDSPCWLVWDKDNGLSDFADCELAWTSFTTATRKVKYRWAGMLQQDMKNKQVRIHPNEKPIPLYRYILETYAKPGDKILDTHLGSAGIAIACHELGYNLDGWEIDPIHYKNALARYKARAQQQQLFLA